MQLPSCVQKKIWFIEDIITFGNCQVFGRECLINLRKDPKKRTVDFFSFSNDDLIGVSSVLLANLYEEKMLEIHAFEKTYMGVEGKLKCPRCDRHFGNHERIRIHLHDVHSLNDPVELAKEMRGIPRLKCPYALAGCTTEFRQGSGRRKHLKMSCAYGPDGVTCTNTNCSARVHKSLVANHLKTCKHSALNYTLRCPNFPKCNSIFKDRNALCNHLRSDCNVEKAKKTTKKVKCEKCEKLFDDDTPGQKKNAGSR